MSAPESVRAVLFDLDGTLLDTGPDLAGALNRLRHAHGLAPLPYAAIRPHVSNGSYALTRLGFSEPEGSPAFEALRLELLDLYHRYLACETRFFPGMEPVLEDLERAGLHWGIVTNKPGWLTTPLLAQLGLSERPGCVISGDTLPERKPHPAPLWLAADQLGCAPASCVYLGDAVRDVEAGRRAGMWTLVAHWGYLGQDEDPHTWEADGLLEHPGELTHWLLDRPARS